MFYDGVRVPGSAAAVAEPPVREDNNVSRDDSGDPDSMELV